MARPGLTTRLGLGTAGLLALVALAPALAQEAAAPPAAGEIDALARATAGTGGSLERARRLVAWVNGSLRWTATDYEQRTADEIIARGGGNCAELSRVLERLLRPAGIRYRWVAEINVQPPRPDRQARAARLVDERGARLSVFGLRHNDHRWLEVLDDGTGRFVPADPSIGVTGIRRWVLYRASLGPRPVPALPDVADVVRDMIVPIAVLVPASAGQPAEDRTDLYLVQELGAAYGGRLAGLPAWEEWTRRVRGFAPRAAAAFAGTFNLHEAAGEIAGLAEAYESLRQQAAEKGIPQPAL